MLAFFSSFVLVSCNQYYYYNSNINESSFNKECRPMITKTKAKWKKHKKKDLYSYDDNYVFELIGEYKDCIKEFDTNRVVSIWGNPSKNIENYRLLYYLSEDCNDENHEICTFLYFTYNSSNKIIDVGHGTSTNIN